MGSFLAAPSIINELVCLVHPSKVTIEAVL